MAVSRGWSRIVPGVFLGLLMASGLAAQAPSAALRSAVNQAGGRVLITLRTPAGAALRAPGDPLLSNAEASRITGQLEADHGIRAHGRALRFGMLFADLGNGDLAALMADSLVESVEADVLSYITDAAPTPPPAAGMATVVADVVPWGITRVAAPTSWTSGTTGAGVKVGIIDSGIDFNHPDLNVVGGYDFTTGSGAASAYADNISSCNGHGTHVAGTVGARQNGSGVVGVAPGVQLYALKVFEIINGGCAAWASNQIAAIDWAVANGLRVVNISIASSSALSAYQNAINNATNAGVLVVAAAGNNSGGAITYPAAYTNAVAVGALTSSDQVAYFSNVGPQMWVAAPGAGITSTMPGGGTGSKNGTSMAAPHVAGVAALLLQLNPTWSTTQVRNALRDGATDLSSPGWDSGTGWGLVQAPTGGSGGAPLALSVSPASRSASVQQGGTAPGDQATVTLSGTNATSTAWTASKRKSWTTLVSGNGTGSGSVTWSRDASGLAAGTYVDTITVTVAGATGSPARVIDTLVVTSGPQPVTLAVSPASRSATVQQGGSAPADSASVAMSGTNAWQVAWTANARQPWTSFTTGSGSGNGKVRWSRNAAGLAAGTYVDTITVTAVGANGSPARVIDTLIVTAAPTALTLAVAPPSRRVTVQQGNTAPGDQASVTLSGANATTAPWTASKRKSWTTLVTSNGIGSGTVSWNRNASGLAAGTYVDTITVSAAGAAGSPARVIDTLVVTSTPVVPLVLAVSPSSRRTTLQQGAIAQGDQATVTITGTDAASTGWSATKRKNWTTLITANGTGNGTVAWNRSAAGLAPGTYVDTITVSVNGASGSPARVIDSLVVTAVDPLAVAILPRSRRVDVIPGNGNISDAADISITGGGAASASWTATSRRSWTNVQTGSGTGPGQLRWQRRINGLAAGTYVDTITVSIGSAAATLIDSLVITSGSGGEVVLAKGGGRKKQLRMDGQQTSVESDSVLVQGISGSAPIGNWTAREGSAWIGVETPTGSFPGYLRWSRNTVGLAAGTHVDSIIVELDGNPAYRSVYVDSVQVVNVVSPTPAQAADALFNGSGNLNTDQRAILDASGNRNGQYDLGDFLAWVDRGNIRLTTSVMAQVQAAMREETEARARERTVQPR